MKNYAPPRKEFLERIEAEHQPKGLSAKTVRNINQVISSAMDFVVAQKIITENPC